MRRRGKISLISMVAVMIMLILQSNAYAGTAWENEAREVNHTQEFSSDSISRVMIQPKGSLISSFEVAISDHGKGTVGLYGAVLCHEAMREIRMNLYLDIWNTELDDWEQIQAYKFIWDQTNTSEDERNAGIVDFEVKGLERGRDYRLRGFAGAYNLDNTLSEAWRADSMSIQVESIENPVVTE